MAIIRCRRDRYARHRRAVVCDVQVCRSVAKPAVAKDILKRMAEFLTETLPSSRSCLKSHLRDSQTQGNQEDRNEYQTLLYRYGYYGHNRFAHGIHG
ncbi:MAG TPA: hypothetical protein VIF10_00325 [Methylobacter sp.]